MRIREKAGCCFRPGRAALVLLAGLWLLTACARLEAEKAEPQKYQEQFFDLFDTVTQISGYAASEQEFRENLAYIRARLEYYAKIYDIYQESTYIDTLWTVNQVAGQEPLLVEPAIFDLLKFGKEMYEQSGGAVNIAFGSVLRIWHEFRQAGMENPEQAKLPDMAKLRAAAAHTNIDDLILDEEAGTVFLRDPEMSLDVGALAKGYAVERVAREMSAAGMTAFLLNVGGNVRAVGAKPNGEPWHIGIQNPDTSSPDAYIEEVWLKTESLVTSGNYQRFYEVEGKRYHHIIDEDTLLPADYFQSVSILCADSGKADAYSTAAFNMPPEESRRFIESLAGVEAMWVLSNGEIMYSSGFAEYLPKE